MPPGPFIRPDGLVSFAVFEIRQPKFPLFENITLSLQKLGPGGRSCRTGKKSPGERKEGDTDEGMSRAHVKRFVADKFQNPQSEGR